MYSLIWTNVHFICRAISTTSCSHTESQVQYADPFPHILPTGFCIPHHARGYNCVLTVVLNKATRDLICLWGGCSLEQKSGHPRAWFQVQGNRSEYLSSSDSTDQGHTAGAGPWWIVQHPPSDLAVMETVLSPYISSFSLDILYLEK